MGWDRPSFPWRACLHQQAPTGTCDSPQLNQHLAFLLILSTSELIVPSEGCEVVIFHLPQEQAELLSDSVWSRKK